ncbi:MAG: aldose epimerase family protein [Terriglobales bacterium]
MNLARVLTALILTLFFAVAAFAIDKQSFGKTSDGREVFLYTLKNHNGMEVVITNFGGDVVSIKVPDRNGKMADVALGFDNVSEYEKQGPYFGALVGRYANRIANGTFTLDGKTYHVPTNDGPNALHGGKVGFDKRVWDAKESSDASGQHLDLHYLSKDGEEGFPGNLKVDVTYTLDDKNELRIAYLATTDKDTVLNLTNHTYFNLKGQGEGDVLQHQIMIHADRFTPVNEHLIPTGELKPVQGTPFDLRKLTAIGAHENEDNEQLKLARGYDHNWVLNSGGKMGLAAKVVEPTTGRVLEVLTDQPGVQFYTGNFLDGTAKGKGKVYNYRYGFCLETQHFPDSPNHPKFPTTELKPGQKFQSMTIYRFSTDKK